MQINVVSSILVYIAQIIVFIFRVKSGENYILTCIQLHERINREQYFVVCLSEKQGLELFLKMSLQICMLGRGAIIRIEDRARVGVIMVGDLYGRRSRV